MDLKGLVSFLLGPKRHLAKSQWQGKNFQTEGSLVGSSAGVQEEDKFLQEKPRTEWQEEGAGELQVALILDAQRTHFF